MSREVFVGKAKVLTSQKEVTGKTTKIHGEEFNLIENVDQMDPYFMTVVSSTDHWMFISSNGGLSAGRKNAENALFPYYSDDKITDSADRVGSKTILRILEGEGVKLWEPFSTCQLGFYSVSRNLYKNQFGSKIIFEEVNHDLEITFRYSWQFSEKFGFVKKGELINSGAQERQIELLDGLQDIMPYGVNRLMQVSTSNLVNGYKRNVLEPQSKMGVFTLSAMIVDRAEPSEALKATTIWSLGLDSDSILLSNKQLQKFRRGESVSTEQDVKGSAGSYFISASIKLDEGEHRDWFLVAEINQDRADVSNLTQSLTNESVREELTKDIDDTAEALKKLVAKADGLQVTEDQMTTGRHVSNVMFNIMRGGIFDENYDVHIDDFKDYLKAINKDISAKYDSAFKSGAVISYHDLIEKGKQSGDSDLLRISYEYLPLTFSRRHGDPSRPWNKFNIDLKYPDGSKKRSYEGNWRDIFQNWEALAYSFPEFIPGMISKFLNATTVDGYNPYRITRQGIDWELIEPDDPWSYIGYWGDHQIIYLLKLLECAQKHNAAAFDDWMSQELFVYASVPYKIKPYADIVKDAQDTIDFDNDQQALTEQMVSKIGGDGKLKFVDGRLLKANFIEKVLVTLLAKMSNFVPEGGIWMNTQRPEWNDANNALVGNGVSMVTLYYMRRFCSFLIALMEDKNGNSFDVHQEVAELLTTISTTLRSHESILTGSISDKERKQIVDNLGMAGESYRAQAYAGFSGAKTTIESKELFDFLELTNRFIDHSIQANKRQDGLYHSYNLLEFDEDKLKVDHLYEMLEGQVAVLSSGSLSGKESLEVLDALKKSAMFREDQYSYFLYPNRNIPHFLQKNEIPAEFVKKSPLIKKLKSSNNLDLVKFDNSGKCFFSGDIHNAKDVATRLDSLTDFQELAAEEKEQILDVFEQMFDHKSFTGRSGTFFSYEGLGSIYWHMVSKLLFACQESLLTHAEDLSDKEKSRLTQHYYEIRAGIGINKTPDLYGAFPTDPYSHTPSHKGAQQPGMTGQVKEDVLNRWAELGVVVSDGELSFRPSFLNADEFLKMPATFNYFDINDKAQILELKKNQLAFTYCQVPIVYEQSDEPRIEVQLLNTKIQLDGDTISRDLSEKVFCRKGNIQRIHVYMNYKS